MEGALGRGFPPGMLHLCTSRSFTWNFKSFNSLTSKHSKKRWRNFNCRELSSWKKIERHEVKKQDCYSPLLCLTPVPWPTPCLWVLKPQETSYKTSSFCPSSVIGHWDPIPLPRASCSHAMTDRWRLFSQFEHQVLPDQRFSNLTALKLTSLGHFFKVLMPRDSDF